MIVIKWEGIEMKIPLGMTLLVLLLAACSSKTVQEPKEIVYEELGANHENLEISLANWERLKESMGASYQYTRKSPSGWGGLKNETTITVKDDFVRQRDYVALDADNLIKSRWREDGFDALNDHAEGAPVKRMDDLYEDCAEILATKRGVEVTFDNSGILKTCHFGKRGIYIENFFFIAR